MKLTFKSGKFASAKKASAVLTVYADCNRATVHNVAPHTRAFSLSSARVRETATQESKGEEGARQGKQRMKRGKRKV